MDNAPSPHADDVELLERMALRIRAGKSPAPAQIEIEQALEGGFARLIGLEAELYRARRLRRGASREAGRPEDSASQPHERDASDAGASPVADLEDQIESLRGALTELRTVSSPPGESRVGYGFVLPHERKGAHAHSD
jgi:hypothetical protein